MKMVPDIRYSRVIAKFVSSSTPKVIIECGANNGIHRSVNLFFEKKGDWKTINIEPNLECYEELVVNRPHSVNYNFALSSQRETKTLYIPHSKIRAYRGGNGTLVEARVGELQEKYDITQFKEQQIQCVTYLDILKMVGLQCVGILVLDVEGHEGEVLEGMIRDCDLSQYPEILAIECKKDSEKTIETLINATSLYGKSRRYKDNLIYKKEVINDNK